MACRVDDKDLPDEQPLLDDTSPSQASIELQKFDYDFVEEPSQDFFCPVTMELFTDPHLTMCCGNHLSQEAANRLKRDGKPCPMCKDPQLNTVPNKHNEIKVCCPHKKSWCEWVGGVNEVKQHSDSCPKRPWQCQYCEFETTYNIGVNLHLPVCTKYPVECPNSCEVGSVPRCDLEAHLMVCPLQPVTCEYAEVGCDVKVPRRDLGRHMEEGQQRHLLSATLLNLRLTRENTEEKNRLLRMIEERDQQIKEKDKKLKEKDETIADFQKQLKQVQDGLEAKVTRLQQQVVKYGENTEEHLKQQDSHVECVSLRFRHLQGFSVHEFTLVDFKKCQARGGNSDWYSEPFYSHPGGYKFQLNVETNGIGDDRGVYVNLLFKLLEGDHDDKLDWPVSTIAHVLLLNQLGDHSHHEKTSTGQWKQSRKVAERLREESTHNTSIFARVQVMMNPLVGIYSGEIRKFIKLKDLELKAENNTQYLKNNSLQFRFYFKVNP